MKLLFDVFPVLLFFIAFQFYGIFVATGVAMAASFAQIGYLLARRRKIDKMLWVSVGVISVFGTATLIFKNQLFIQWKPTVLYWIFAASLIVAWIGFRKNLVRSIMQQQMTLPDKVWSKLLVSWIAFFAAMGALNLYVVYNFSLEAWAAFKLYGGIGLMLAFMFVQALVLARHMHDKT